MDEGNKKKNFAVRLVVINIIEFSKYMDRRITRKTEMHKNKTVPLRIENAIK